MAVPERYDDMVAVADLPTTQFTAGLVAKLKGITIPEAHAELAVLVSQGKLTKKTAKSGAINYKLPKNAANAKKAGTAPKSRPASVPKTSGPKASENSQERYDLAKTESKNLKAWEKAGGKGRRPSTPNLDALKQESADRAAGIKPKRKTPKKSGDTGPRGTTVQFYVDERKMPDSQNKLSSVAYQATAGIGGDDVVRISVKDLKDILADVGIKDPSNTVWTVELANGKTLHTEAM